MGDPEPHGLERNPATGAYLASQVRSEPLSGHLVLPVLGLLRNAVRNKENPRCLASESPEVPAGNPSGGPDSDWLSRYRPGSASKRPSATRHRTRIAR